MPELNLGQLVRILRAEYLVDAQSLSKVKGQPFTAGEIQFAITEALDGLAGVTGQNQEGAA